jgi:hypothetical protein
MSSFNRLIKGLVGAVLGAFFFAALSVMSSVHIFGLSTKESKYAWINAMSLIIGSAVGAVLLSKAKWWQILVVAVTVLIMFSIVMSKVP